MTENNERPKKQRNTKDDKQIHKKRKKKNERNLNIKVQKQKQK